MRLSVTKHRCRNTTDVSMNLQRFPQQFNKKLRSDCAPGLFIVMCSKHSVRGGALQPWPWPKHVRPALMFAPTLYTAIDNAMPDKGATRTSTRSFTVGLPSRGCTKTKPLLEQIKVWYSPHVTY